MTKAEIQQVKQRFGIIGNTEALSRAIDVAIQVAPTDLSVLSPAILMNDLWKTFFSDTTFSGNQHRQIGRRYLNGNIYGT